MLSQRRVKCGGTGSRTKLMRVPSVRALLNFEFIERLGASIRIGPRQTRMLISVRTIQPIRSKNSIFVSTNSEPANRA